MTTNDSSTALPGTETENVLPNLESEPEYKIGDKIVPMGKELRLIKAEADRLSAAGAAFEMASSQLHMCRKNLFEVIEELYPGTSERHIRINHGTCVITVLQKKHDTDLL